MKSTRLRGVERAVDYKALYITEHRKAAEYWADKNANRASYEADVWYNRNRNELNLAMLGDICTCKKILAVGASQWVEREFLEKIDAVEITKIDIVGNPKENIIEADAHHLPFDNESYDMVICREVIEHVHNADQVFSEMRRVLKPKGYLFITTPNAYNLHPDGTIHLRAYSPRSFLKEVAELGFKVIKKGGNVPFIFCSLLTLTHMGFSHVLEEFQEMAEVLRDCEVSYYISSQMFILAQKVE